MSYPDKEQIGKIEQGLEAAEQEFRRASDARDFTAMMQAHNRICHLVASLSAAWSGGKATVFSKYFAVAQNRNTVPMNHAGAGQAPAPAPVQQAPAEEVSPADQELVWGQPAATAPASPEPAPSSSSSSDEMSWLSALPATETPPAPAPVEVKADEPEEDIPDIAVLEKQLAELASKMQKCLGAGDMDGMLQANEKMGQLSELMAKAEARKKKQRLENTAAMKAAQAGAAPAANKPGPPAAAAGPAGGISSTGISGPAPKAPVADSGILAKLDEAAAASPNKVISAAQTAEPKSLAGGWSAGDTLAFAKARAEERKQKLKLADSFESVVGQVVDVPGATPLAEQPNSAVDMFFNDRMKAKIRDSGTQEKPPAAAAPTPAAPPPKPQMTPEQLREKLEGYNFYEILAIPSTASFEELHKAFMKKIRKLNKKLADKTMDEWQFQEFVAALCLAHDVLKYPNARLQYDLVLFGPADGSGPTAEQAAKQKMMPLKDMLKFSTLIRMGELSEAIEMHKEIKDEREIGRYLVEKGLLSSEEFDSILFAQKLVSAGKLTVAQFELAMQEMRENSIPLLDTLVASEWIQPQDVFSGDFL